MRRTVAVLLLLLFTALISTACTPKPASLPLIADVGPIEFFTFDELAEGVNTVRRQAKTEFTEHNSDLIKSYNLNRLTEYYILDPEGLDVDLKLNRIKVKDRYVALEYKVEVPLKTTPDARDSGINELLDTVVFEWTREEDGPELLKHTIEQQKLLPYKSGSAIYYSDIYWTAQPDIILAKEFFWVQDGFMFMMSIPLSILKEETTIKARKVSITGAENNEQGLDTITITDGMPVESVDC